jgi:hypothetical protein
MTTQYKWIPSEPTIEMLDAVFALEEPNTLREYEAMWQAAPEVEQKPVMYVEKGLICYTSLADDQSYLMSVDVSYLWNHRFPEGTKFYTHPQLREPLSENELDKLIDDSIVNGTIRSLCRAIEKAHGIGETKCT